METALLITLSQDDLSRIVADAVRTGIKAAIADLQPKTADGGPDRLLTVQQAAEHVGLSISGIRKAVTRGDLVVRRVGRAVRIRETDLRAFADGTVPGRKPHRAKK